MTWVLLIGAVWLTIAALVGVLIGRSIRLADRKNEENAAAAAAPNFVVDLSPPPAVAGSLMASTADAPADEHSHERGDSQPHRPDQQHPGHASFLGDRRCPSRFRRGRKMPKYPHLTRAWVECPLIRPDTRGGRVQCAPGDWWFDRSRRPQSGRVPTRKSRGVPRTEDS